MTIVDPIAPLGWGDRRRVRSMLAPLHGPGRGWLAAAMVTDVAAKKLATTAADCGACRDAFLHDAGDPHCALHLQVRATLAGSGRLAAGDGGG